jgi:hypothetical protein
MFGLALLPLGLFKTHSGIAHMHMHIPQGPHWPEVLALSKGVKILSNEWIHASCALQFRHG